MYAYKLIHNIYLKRYQQQVAKITITLLLL